MRILSDTLPRPAWALSFVLGLLVACASPPITPDGLEDLAPEEPAAAEALAVWKEGVGLANAFLVSEQSQTLPAGHIELAPDGMWFVTEEETRPIAVKQTAWGTFARKLGFDGQERSWGFIVGRSGEGDRLYANSLFRDRGGDWWHPVHLGGLVLHELTHMVFETGTVGFWKGTAYYLEALFLFRYRNHSAERVPYAVTEEYLGWARETGAL